MIFNTPFICRLFVMMCCLKCILSSILSKDKTITIFQPLRLLIRQKPVHLLQLPQEEANEVNPFQLPGSSPNNNSHALISLHRPLGAASTSTLHSNCVLIQTGLCSSVINCENIPTTAEACRTYVQSHGTLVFVEDVTSSHLSRCDTSSVTGSSQWYFKQAKLSTTSATQEGDITGYRFVCDECQQSLLLATTGTSSSTQDRLEMNSRGLTEMSVVTSRRRLAACLRGWNEWTATSEHKRHGTLEKEDGILTCNSYAVSSFVLCLLCDYYSYILSIVYYMYSIIVYCVTNDSFDTLHLCIFLLLSPSFFSLYFKHPKHIQIQNTIHNSY